MKRLVLSPEVFLWESTEKCLVYNSKTRNGFIAELDSKLFELISKLQTPDSLYSVVLTESLLSSKDVTVFLSSILELKAGRIVNDNPDLTLSIKPILKIRDDASYFKWQYHQGVTGDIINNLHCIIINAGSHYGDDLLAKQTLFPIRNIDTPLDKYGISEFILKAKSSTFLSEICIVGDYGGIFDEDFLNRISPISNLTFYLYYGYIKENPNILGVLSRYGKITVVVRATNDIDHLFFNLSEFKDHISHVNVLIEDESHNETLENLSSIIPTPNSFSIIPVFNGNNLKFIHDILDFDIDELLLFGPNKHEIFINQTLNIFDFGKLFVLPSGLVYANLCNKPIGSISDRLSKLIMHELLNGNSWLRSRREGECGKCIFRYLCPSPSNYETLTATQFSGTYSDNP